MIFYCNLFSGRETVYTVRVFELPSVTKDTTNTTAATDARPADLRRELRSGRISSRCDNNITVTHCGTDAANVDTKQFTAEELNLSPTLDERREKKRMFSMSDTLIPHIDDLEALSSDSPVQSIMNGSFNTSNFDDSSIAFDNITIPNFATEEITDFFDKLESESNENSSSDVFAGVLDDDTYYKKSKETNKCSPKKNPNKNLTFSNSVEYLESDVLSSLRVDTNGRSNKSLSVECNGFNANIMQISPHATLKAVKKNLSMNNLSSEGYNDDHKPSKMFKKNDSSLTIKQPLCTKLGVITSKESSSLVRSTNCIDNSAAIISPKIEKSPSLSLRSMDKLLQKTKPSVCQTPVSRVSKGSPSNSDTSHLKTYAQAMDTDKTTKGFLRSFLSSVINKKKISCEKKLKKIQGELPSTKLFLHTSSTTTSTISRPIVSSKVFDNSAAQKVSNIAASKPVNIKNDNSLPNTILKAPIVKTTVIPEASRDMIKLLPTSVCTSLRVVPAASLTSLVSQCSTGSVRLLPSSSSSSSTKLKVLPSGALSMANFNVACAGGKTVRLMQNINTASALRILPGSVSLPKTVRLLPTGLTSAALKVMASSFTTCSAKSGTTLRVVPSSIASKALNIVSSSISSPVFPIVSSALGSTFHITSCSSIPSSTCTISSSASSSIFRISPPVNGSTALRLLPSATLLPSGVRTVPFKVSSTIQAMPITLSTTKNNNTLVMQDTKSSLSQQAIKGNALFSSKEKLKAVGMPDLTFGSKFKTNKHLADALSTNFSDHLKAKTFLRKDTELRTSALFMPIKTEQKSSNPPVRSAKTIQISQSALLKRGKSLDSLNSFLFTKGLKSGVIKLATSTSTINRGTVVLSTSSSSKKTAQIVTPTNLMKLKLPDNVSLKRESNNNLLPQKAASLNHVSNKFDLSKVKKEEPEVITLDTDDSPPKAKRPCIVGVTPSFATSTASTVNRALADGGRKPLVLTPEIIASLMKQGLKVSLPSTASSTDIASQSLIMSHVINGIRPSMLEAKTAASMPKLKILQKIANKSLTTPNAIGSIKQLSGSMQMSPVSLQNGSGKSTPLSKMIPNISNLQPVIINGQKYYSLGTLNKPTSALKASTVGPKKPLSVSETNSIVINGLKYNLSNLGSGGLKSLPQLSPLVPFSKVSSGMQGKLTKMIPSALLPKSAQMLEQQSLVSSRILGKKTPSAASLAEEEQEDDIEEIPSDFDALSKYRKAKIEARLDRKLMLNLP